MMIDKIPTVIHFTGMKCSKLGGIEKYFLALAEELEQNKIRLVLVYESSVDNQEYLERLSKQNVTLELVSVRESCIILSSLRIAKIIRKYRPNIIHAHFEPASSLVVLISKFLGVSKIYLTLHSTVLPLDSLRLKSVLISKIRNLCASQIFAVSNAIRLQHISNFPTTSSKCITQYIGIETHDYQSVRMKKSNFVLLNVAFHHYDKGIDILLRALSKLVCQNGITNFKLYQIGAHYNYTDNLKKLVDELNLSGYVEFLGIRNDVINIMKDVDVYIQPSRYEGIGLALIEAMSMGCIAVGSKVGGIPEVINDGVNGYLFKRDSDVDLANCLLRILDDPLSASVLGRAGQLSIKRKFSLRINVKSYVDEYILFN